VVVQVVQDQSIPVGFGRLIGISMVGSRDAVLWFEDSAGTIRAVRMGCDISNGLALTLKGQAQIVRS
jgi:hypothetical protein